MKRRPWLTPVLVALAAAVVLYFLARPVPVEERTIRVRPGMTRAEVETVLGGPPGEYTHGVVYIRSGDFVTGAEAERFGAWLWDDGVVHVWFDEAGRVEMTRYYPNEDAPTGLTVLRARLGL